MRKLLSGNEAIAQGAREAGVLFASAYPGTPSTEILETIARQGGIRVQWAPNEKVAYEVAAGVALGGGRALVSMKHVGVNVAADPLFSSSYSGVNGGLVLVSADDPGMHSSQNEQDNRHLARAAKIPVLEPSDSQEARDFTRLAFEISEQLDTPVMLRVTTRICHSMSPVVVEEDQEDPEPIRRYRRDMSKNVLLPAHARRRHAAVERRLLRLVQLGESARELNRVEWGDRRIGIVTSGVAYQYVREVAPDASVLKLGLTYPLPSELVREFAAGVEALYVVEELDPFLEGEIRSLGLSAVGKEVFPVTGELDPDRVAAGLGVARIRPSIAPPDPGLPLRPPVLCAGCGHRAAFYTLAKMGLVVTGDIGCYTLGTLPPLLAMDTCMCMGASVGMAQGMEIALREAKDERRVVAVIGDSTFVHSGITGLINLVYNGGTGTVLILDNGTTAMTGHQDHPGTGVTASGEKTHRLDFAALCRAIGVRRVREMDPYDLDRLESALNEELAADEPSVIICRAPCRLVERTPLGQPAEMEIDCPGCGACLELGCPAIDERDGRSVIDPTVCTGCGLCAQICPFCGLKVDSIRREPVPV